MLYRKISSLIETHLSSGSSKILLIDGARQVGKTYIIRHVGQKLFDNFIELNMVEDYSQDRLFDKVGTVDDFYFRVSISAGNKMHEKSNTLIFIDEIQTYPHLLTLLKFLQQDNRYTYICSGSLLGVALSETTSLPMGSVRKVQMYPLDFEEFLYANGLNQNSISALRNKFKQLETLDQALHDKMLDFFRKYLIVGGMPEAVDSWIKNKNIYQIREIQKEIHHFYATDASKYDQQKKLKIRRIYDLLPSNMEKRKKRVVACKIEDKKDRSFLDYQDEFDYLIGAGIALPVQAVSTPVFPLLESSRKNLLKLYLNDVGLLTGILYGSNVQAILNDEGGINLGSVYECAVACELKAHNYRLYYYDNRSKGEVDFLLDDYASLSTLPIEVKSGKDYAIHSALNTFVGNPDYHIKEAFVLSNQRTITRQGKITHIPIYFVMFFNNP